MILRRRSQLLEWLEKNAPTASIRRAVGEGAVEFLGWFSQIPGSKFPGWIVQAYSPITDKRWDVVVRLNRPFLTPGYHVWILVEEIPWQFWNPDDSINPFFCGDNIEQYKLNRKTAKTQGCPEVHQENIPT